jgi:tetratricopeptide (TPR) repeat protein
MQLDVLIAQGLFHRALDLVAPDHEEQLAALLGLAAAAFEAGRLEESIKLYEDALAMLRPLDDPLRLGKALADYGTTLRRRGDTQQARQAVTEAVRLLEGEPAGPELAFAYTGMAGQEMMAGRPRECREWADKALTLSRTLGLDHVTVRALDVRGVARCMANDLDGLDDMREALQLGLDTGVGMETGPCYVNLGEELSWREGPEAGRAVYEEGIGYCERHGLERIAYVLRMHALRPLFHLGRWEELLVLAELVERQLSHGHRWTATTALTERAGVLVRRGAIGEARSLVDSFLEPARRIDNPQTLGPALVCAALIAHANGDERAAVRRIEELEVRTRDRGPADRALYVSDAARICAVTGQLALAKQLLQGLEGLVAPRHAYSVQSAHAVLAEADGSLDEALVGYSETGARWREFGDVVEEAHALLGRGRCLVRLDRRDEAAEPLAASRAIFERLGAGPLVAEVDEQLGD